MHQVFAIALAAGIAAALLSGVVTPGSTALVPLTFIAPAPLMIAGLGWHPLVAALGALLAAIGVSLTVGSKVALSFIVMVGLPAYLLVELVMWLMRTMPAGTRVNDAGRVIGLYVLGGIAVYSALAVLVGAFAVDMTYAGFEQRLGATFQRMMQQLGRSDGQIDTTTSRQLAQVFVRAFVPLSSILIAMILTFSLWLSVKFLRKTERLPFASFPAYEIALQRDAVGTLAVAILMAQMTGFVGLYGSAMVGALVFMFMLNGLAVIHQRTLGSTSRTPILWLCWIVLLLFAPAALLFSVVGLLDALFGLRRAGTPTT